MFKKLLSLAMSVYVFSTLAFAQSGTLTGTVTSAETGETLPAVNVVLVESMKGASTDADGNYTISNITPGTYTVEVTYIGYSTISQSITISAGDNVQDFEMATDVGLLDEIIVSGVADNTPRKKLTISVAKVDAAQLSKVPATSVASSLSGKVSGVQIRQTSGTPGGQADIQVRSDNNLGVGSNPLIIIDGVILEGSLGDINTDDLESIEVVKGAAASSLYGSRAGNGVVVITTKRGSLLQDGDVSVTVRNEVGFQELENYIDLAEAHYFDLADDWESAKGTYTKFAGVTYPAGYEGGFSPDVIGTRAISADNYMDNPFGVTRDLQKDFFQKGSNMTNYVALATRVSNINLFTSFENNVQEGIIPNTDGYNRRNFRINSDWTVNDWLKVSTSNLFVRTTSNTPGTGGGIFFDIVLAEPDNNLFMDNPDGQPYYVRHNQWCNETNPLYGTWINDRNTYKQRYLGNYTATAQLTDWLEAKASYSLESNNERYTSLYPYTQWILGGGSPLGIEYSQGSLYQYSIEEYSQTLQTYLTTRQQFGKLYAKLTLSYLLEDYHTEWFDAYGFDFKVQGVPGFDAIDPANISADNYQADINAENYFAIASFDYDDKYLFDAMIRRDGSSLFGPDSRWNNYYRVSAAYRITEDIDLEMFDELKVRVAQGTAGIRPAFAWQYETFALSAGNASKTQLGNRDLKPSQTKETEFAINGTVMSKYNFELIYAKSVTTDQFLNVPLLPVTGYSNQYQNAGTLEGESFEFNLQANLIRNQDMTWDVGVTWAKSSQTITELDPPPFQSGPDGLFYIREGETYGAIYGYTWVTSLDQMSAQLAEGDDIANYVVNSDGFVIAAGTEGTPDESPIKLRDANGDFAFVEIGNGRPDWTAGISNTVSYKGLSAYVLVDIKSGGDVYNRKSQWLTRDSRNGIMDQTGKPEAEKKAFGYYQGFYDVNTNNSYWVENGSYVKLREVSLSYTINPENLNLLGDGIESITLSAIGRNLLTFTDYSGYDPEVGSIRNPFDATGAYPNFRNYAFSVSFKF
jgi:TonB-linked SusC/RagA family outer membrane protein